MVQAGALVDAGKEEYLRAATDELETTIAGETFLHDLTIEPLYDAASNAIEITCSSLEVTGQRGSARPPGKKIT